MNPTVWSLFFESYEMTPDLARAIRDSAPMDALQGELRSVLDCTFPHASEKAVGDALHEALSTPVLDVLTRAWRTHPGLPAEIQSGEEEEPTVLFGLGEHEIVSTHRPRVDVLGPSGMLGSFEFDLRLELMVQCATLQIEENGRVSCVSMGACSGTGSLNLGDRELARFHHLAIPFPETVSVDLNVLDPPPEDTTEYTRLVHREGVTKPNR
jgi:hypothetical protein